MHGRDTNHYYYPFVATVPLMEIRRCKIKQYADNVHHDFLNKPENFHRSNGKLVLILIDH